MSFYNKYVLYVFLCFWKHHSLFAFWTTSRGYVYKIGAAKPWRTVDVPEQIWKEFYMQNGQVNNNL